MRAFALTLAAVACACVLSARALREPAVAQASALRLDLREEIARARNLTWRWQIVMGLPRTRAERVRVVASASYQRWVLRLWHGRAQRLRLRALNPPHKDEFLCIHRYEGPWTAATGNGYYGGLQMDIPFQAQWGRHLLRRKGTANRWSPIEQIWVAERALHVVGFGAWPNTARSCGLL